MTYELDFAGLKLDEAEHTQIEDEVQNLIGKYIGRDFVCSDEKQIHREEYFKARNILEELISDIRENEKEEKC